jgi:hypothetical protein
MKNKNDKQKKNSYLLGLAAMSLLPQPRTMSAKASEFNVGDVVRTGPNGGLWKIEKISGLYALLIIDGEGADTMEDPYLIMPLDNLEAETPTEDETTAKQQVGVLPDGSPVYDDGEELVDENGDPVDEDEVSYAKKTAGQTKKSVAGRIPNASSLFYVVRK